MPNENLPEVSEAPVGQTSAYPAKKLGEFVTYLSSRGSQKAALVLGTPESVNGHEGSPVPSLEQGQLHLLVFSPTGSMALRHTVPNQQFAAEHPEFDENANVWF